MARGTAAPAPDLVAGDAAAALAWPWPYRAAPLVTLHWQAAPAWRPALREVLKVVSAFTVAHSVTLALAVLGVVNPPSRWIESLIAASVALVWLAERAFDLALLPAPG